jgi:hypothetical protein
VRREMVDWGWSGLLREAEVLPHVLHLADFSTRSGHFVHSPIYREEG